MLGRSKLSYWRVGRTSGHTRVRKDKVICTYRTILVGKTLQKLTARSGIIQSPGYPSNYPPNTDCYWEIARPKDGACVLFTVEDFNVPSEDEVRY